MIGSAAFNLNIQVPASLHYGGFQVRRSRDQFLILNIICKLFTAERTGCQMAVVFPGLSPVA